MDPITIFEKFGLPIAIIIILLIAVCTLFFILWRYAEKREEQLRADLKEARAQAEANNEKFISALKDQNQVARLISDALIPVKNSTDLIPTVASTQRETLSEVNHIVNLVRDRDTQPVRRRGDPDK